MYRKNVAGQYLYFALVNASTGAALTGATVAGKRGIDGAAQASVTGTISEEAGGQYKIALSQADINGNNIGFLFTATSAIPVSISVVTTAADPTDSVRLGLTALPNAAASAVGGLPVAVDSSGRVDVLKINGTSQTARDIGASVLVGDKTGFSLSAAGVQAVWDALSTALTTVGSIGKRLVDNLTGDIYARIGAPAGASVSADIAAAKVDTAAVKVQTDKLTFTVANQIDANVLDWKSSAAPAMTGDAFARLGAPAGASVSADVAAVKVDTAAISAKTTNLPASPAAVSDIPTANANADALLDRTAGVESGWTIRQAMRIVLSALGGKLAGAATTSVTVRDMADTKNRISATVDANGNRTAVTLDAT